LVERDVEGLILLPASDTEATEIDTLLASSGIPLVLLARHFDLDHDYVGADNVLAGQLIGEHLRSLGVGTVAFVGGPCNTSARREREAGLVQACEPSGIALLGGDDLGSAATPSGGAEATRRLLDR